jgi:hypothetical protein
MKAFRGRESQKDLRSKGTGKGKEKEKEKKKESKENGSLTWYGG